MRCFLLTALTVIVGCGSPPAVSPTQTDAAVGADRPITNCSISFVSQPSVTLAPNTRLTLRARLDPFTSGDTVRFGLIGSASDAALSVTEAAVGPDGVATTELVAPTDHAMFRVRATAPCSAESFVNVTVSARPRGEIVAEAIYHGARRPSDLEVLLVPGDECLTDPPSDLATRVSVPLPGATVRFSDLPDNARYVIQGRANGDDTVLATACAGPVRVGESTSTIPLVFVDAPLHLDTAYTLRLQTDLSALSFPASDRWMAPLHTEVTTAGSDAAVFAPDLLAAVLALAPAQTHDAVRRSFTEQFTMVLAPRLGTLLHQRDATLTAVFSRIATSTASALSSPVITATLTQDPASSTVFQVTSPAASIDPGTPDVISDDTTTVLGTRGAVALALGPGDTVTAIAEPLPLSFTRLATAALTAVLRRLGASTSTALASAAVCPVVSAAVSDALAALGCDSDCVSSACSATVRRVATRFDTVVSTDSPTLTDVSLRFSGLGRPTNRGLIVDHVEGVAAGRYLDDPSATVLAAATLSRSAPR